ncbi:hypothetical protein CWR48_01665 [Oceanobacillus arenosus]|uniref:SHOCT domain-containing protein n=1 Tax=Oceanobacillus arenosus TaxID=1229153 RepID=A0A3D8Q1Y2_9BACI|nr:SHOCT domain-containing protein [Oceanobacillus arenosus]RDW22440.1 hypothetical protein CWR48_01665 [Oceanobacillus arenosus]
MHHWGFFPPFGFFFILIIALVISNIIMWRRIRKISTNSMSDALFILETRLAKGEINTDEYNEVKEALKK